MSWIPGEESVKKTWLESLLIRILKCGSIPSHVAFIMDGNRRFAKSKRLDKIQGHSMGFDKLAETLQWCHEFGIKEVTVYAFSIENYKRPQSEVEGLMDLAREKFRRLLREREKLEEHGIKVRVLGNLSLLPEDLQDLIREAMEVTRDNSRCTLNIAFSYTAREELTSAVRLTSEAVKRGLLQPEDITDELIERCLYTRMARSTDLLIRTSGEVRLSDFLLWQSAYSVTYFTSVLWPDFTLEHLMAGIFYYQRNAAMIKLAKPVSRLDESSLQKDDRIAKFIESLDDNVVAATIS